MSEQICPVCQSELEWTECWKGCDEGFFDEYDEDPINFSPGESLIECEECHGEGGYLQCPSVDEEWHYKLAKEAA